MEHNHYPLKLYLLDKPGSIIDDTEYHLLMQTYRTDETHNDSEAGKDGKLEEESIEE